MTNLISIETYSENGRIMEKIASLLIEANIAVLCNLTETGITCLEKKAKRRILGHKLTILTRPEYKKIVLRFILDNHDEKEPKIFVKPCSTETLGTEKWVKENMSDCSSIPALMS